MRKTFVLLAGVCLASSAALAQSPTYKKIQLSDQFYCEGANYADFNKDNKLDLVAGPFWYEGPDFAKKHEIYPPKVFKPAPEYSDNFLTFVGDFNNDSWPDLLVVGFPGREAYWFEHPGSKGGHWKKRLAFKSVASESPVFGDFLGDGKLRLVFTGGGFIGYGEPDPSDIEKPWRFHPITRQGRYNGHGSGFGDLSGDGKMDILASEGWYEQPASIQEGQPWVFHSYKFADAAANMLVYDVDGDGLNDVITSVHCHHYGIVWHQQTKADGKIAFKSHTIVGKSPEENPQGVKFTQHHAYDLVDINGDGLKDFVTGKRFWAHGPKGDSEPDAPCVLYWFELKRDKDKGASYIAHRIDDNSGVGTQVVAADLNGDKVPEIIVGNKKGVFLFLGQAGAK